MIWLWFMIIWVGDIRIMKICSSGDMTVYLHNVSILVANMEIWWVYTVPVLASDDLVAYHSWFVIVFVFGLVDQVGQWPIPNMSQPSPLRLCAVEETSSLEWCLSGVPASHWDHHTFDMKEESTWPDRKELFVRLKRCWASKSVSLQEILW